MKLFKKLCNHDWVVTHTSNIVQPDGMGYPLRLVIKECKKCGKSEQIWLDTNYKENDFVLEWREV